jgi:hypothetical protein
MRARSADAGKLPDENGLEISLDQKAKGEECDEADNEAYEARER